MKSNKRIAGEVACAMLGHLDPLRHMMPTLEWLKLRQSNGCGDYAAPISICPRCNQKVIELWISGKEPGMGHWSAPMTYDEDQHQ